MEGLVNYSSEDDQDEQSSEHLAERGSAVKRDSGAAADSKRHRSSSHQRQRSSSRPKERERDRGGHSRDEATGHGARQPKHSNGKSSSSRHRDKSPAGKSSRESKSSRDYRDSSRKGDRNHSKDHRGNDQRRRDDERDYQGNGRGSHSSSFSKGRSERHGRHNDSSASSSHNKQNRSRDDAHHERRDRQKHRDRSAERYRRRDRGHRDAVSPPRSRSRSHSTRSRTPTPERHHSKRHDKTSSAASTAKRYTPRSRSGSRTRTPPRSRSGSHDMSASKPLEKARLTALEMEKKIKMSAKDDFGNEDAGHGSGSSTPVDHIAPVPVRKIVPLMSLPLADSIGVKLPNLMAMANAAQCAGGGGLGGGEAGNAGVGKDPSVIQLPSYYNRSAINPTKYAEQVQKRKLIWGAKKAEDTAAKWGNAQFSEDSDGKVASKFMRLMGIKGAVAPKPPEEAANSTAVAPDVKTREAMFSNMEQQYEVARQTTHTMRGVGLGFSSARPF